MAAATSSAEPSRRLRDAGPQVGGTGNGIVHHPQHRRVDDPGADRVGADAVRRPLGGHLPGQRQHARLARVVVGARLRGVGHQPGGGGDVDDGPRPPRRDQRGGHRPAGQERAAQVDRQHVVPLARGQVEQRRDPVHPGGIDEHVGGAVQQPGGAGDGGGHGARVADVAGHRRGTEAGGGGQGIRAPVEQHHLRAFGQQPPRAGQPDPPRSPGDERPAARHPAGHHRLAAPC